MRVGLTAVIAAAALAGLPEATSALTVIGTGTSAASTVQAMPVEVAPGAGQPWRQAEGLSGMLASGKELPEPAIWATMSLGLLVVGSILRRRRFERMPVVTD